jgi:hypothetical protein
VNRFDRFDLERFENVLRHVAPPQKGGSVVGWLDAGRRVPTTKLSNHRTIGFQFTTDTT